MNNFQHWHDEIADIPLQDKNGEWYDAETGFYYSEYLKEAREHEVRSNKFKPNDKTKEARSIAKNFGGKALKGTIKQKVWAEQIRVNVLKNVSTTQAEAICYLKMFEYAAFWISNKDMTSEKIGNNAEIAKELIAEINKLYREIDKNIIEDKNKWLEITEKGKELVKERENIIDQFKLLFKFSDDYFYKTAFGITCFGS